MIRNILTSNLVETNVQVSDWKTAARLAGNLLLNSNKVKPDFIDSMINVVEKYGPYMILVPKVCFFHGEPGINVNESCLSLVVFKEPVYFKEYDNQQINCAFAFGAKDKDSHIKILQSLVSLLQDNKFIELITSNYPKEQIMSVIEKY